MSAPSAALKPWPAREPFVPADDEADRAPAVVVRAPTGPSAPLVFASPHSGRLYPRALLDEGLLDGVAIRRSEDAFVDTLIAGATACGATVVEAVYARAYVDVNRDPWELDPLMFVDDLPASARSQTARVAAGLGAVPRVVGEGQEIYRRKLRWAEAQSRLDAVHRPYHAALNAAVEETVGRHGVCVLIDWHSMPSAAARAEARRGRPRPDVVLGDRHGQSCARLVTETTRRLLEGSGYAVGVNSPYAGGWTTQTYGRPGGRVHALQIELDRRLYMHEGRLEPGPDFDAVRGDIERLSAALAAVDWPARLS